MVELKVIRKVEEELEAISGGAIRIERCPDCHSQTVVPYISEENFWASWQCKICGRLFGEFEFTEER